MALSAISHFSSILIVGVSFIKFYPDIPTFAKVFARMKRFLIISTVGEPVRFVPERVVYFSSDGNYSTLVQVDEETRLLSYQLG